MGVSAKKINNHQRGTVQDITECRKAEVALQESEEMFRRFVETSPDLLFQVNRSGRIEYVSPRATKIYGYEPHELIGKHLRTTTPAKEVPKALKALKKVLAGNPLKNFELNQKDKAGRIIQVEINVVPIYKEGKIVGAQGVMRNITERKRAEEALRESEEKFRHLAEKSPNMIYLNMKGRVVYANERCKEVMGYTRQEFCASNFDFFTLVAPESREMVKETFSKHMNGEEVATYEHTLITREGKEIEAINATKLIKLGGEKAILGIATDITERKQAERELQRSYNRLLETLIATVNTLAATIEVRDPYTAGHQRRVTILACTIAEAMDLTENQFDGLRMAGLIHDLGKLTVPVEILNKASSLSETEFSIIKSHPQTGYNLLKEIEFPWPVAQIVLQHHERMDGSGYPQGLKGEEILLEAKILAVADVVEAMVSHRPYRAALGIETALGEISKNNGVLYDHEVVDACNKLFTEKGFTLE
jgi:PAS domain S-box-containing protein